ncbi:glycosyltransferase family 2 protein [Photobacterium leiognathi]|uniref:glycosyltransferase family 2 protein n=1 Tax=Photobacterium leiognathi TaxID=553611 RepID=UPI00020884DC|nr:glycosyltransferase family A protein [Photobacterium leiognathi]PSW53761.1 glycosyltransferase family 2 protein [Photobacterium leiognathi subsp. mandapamensis]GAA04682.1 glycosyl transferase 2 family protein [Photobacterium leiognathi subsp. mandapamensis svers.1.1.]
MKYTIAIPTYNNEKTLRDTIDSCINQIGGLEYEILISDDGSTDNSHEIYEDFEKYNNVNIVKHKENSSLYDNHNKCLHLAKGDYILFCHADDILVNDALLKVDRALGFYNYPSKIVCFGRSFFRDFFKNYCKVGKLNEIVSGIAAQQLFQNGGLTPSGTCYSRRTFLDNGGFLPMRSRITHSDMNSMIMYSLDGAEFLMIDRLLFKREFASTACNISSEANFKAKEEAFDELYKVIGSEKMEKLFKNIDEFTEVNIVYMSILSKYSNNKKLKFKLKLKYLLRNPLSLINAHVMKLLLK